MQFCIGEALVMQLSATQALRTFKGTARRRRPNGSSDQTQLGLVLEVLPLVTSHCAAAVRRIAAQGCQMQNFSFQLV